MAEQLEERKRAIGGMSARPAPWFKGGLWFIVGLQVVLVALAVTLETLARSVTSSLGPGFLVEMAGNVLSTLTFPAVGALIFWRRPEHPIGWLFCAANLGWAINNLAGAYVRYALVADPGSLPAGEMAAWFYTWPGMISEGLYALLVLLFPDGRLPSPRWRSFTWIVALWSAAAAVIAAFAPGQIDETIGVEVANPLGVEGSLGDLLAQLDELTMLLAMGLFALAAAAMVLRWRRASGIERQQLKWFASSAALASILFCAVVLFPVPFGSSPEAPMPGWAQALNFVTILSFGTIIPAAAGLAILRYHLYDIDLLINRTLVYSSLTATLLALYFGAIVVLQRVLVLLTGERSTLAVVASTLLIAALFNPLRRSIQSFIDRRFYRRKYDARKTLEAFSAKLRDETDLEGLNEELVGVVRETMQPSHVSLWLRPDTAAQREDARG